LFAAALVVAPLAILFVAKPTVGAAVFFARPSRWAFIGAAVFGGIAFLVQPGWVAEWFDAIRRNNAHWAPTTPYRAPVTFIGGPLVLLALLRWRRADARLVAAMVCVPQTLVLYDVVPLFLVPRTFWQAVFLVVISHTGHFWVRAHLPPGYHESLNYALVGQAMIWSLFLPCTAMVLLRSNEGRIPKWMERSVARWPAWLRGRPPTAHQVS
jgi:hypothetical protein